ncbi:hypothetical protein FGG08_007361 [Glutinoglossum americanum]|uniref:Heterokaryon incompatibility domain-containing protein n=1 Tax=Glutinoglossum americanum TaxID=1670608 RepID=A0A9P8I1L4_9PEZI|nr:hypothetical protein FGG08_007361 [Glutinoglossum americanum]
MADTDNDHPEFDNNSKWPRRLLHVPSMTSCKWAPGNTYRGCQNPPYIALSYTWGRFQLRTPEQNPQVTSIPVRGVPWAIPRVDPDRHFSVDEFQYVINETMKTAERYYEFDDQKSAGPQKETWGNRIVRPVLRFLEKRRTEYEFLWLDIACIDQRESSTKLAEVGRQARIFQNAKHSYVWLSHLPHERLNSFLLDFQSAVAGLQAEPYSAVTSFNSAGWLSMAIQALEGLTADPWFSSLWTLQEGYLCNHAIILSREGRVSCDQSLIAMRSFSLNILFKLAFDLVLWSERTTAPRSEPEYTQVVDLIRRTGMGALWYNNPMGLLGVSNHRKTSRALDRVYAIMQAFGTDFRVGVNPDHVYTLEELEDEFGAAIIRTYPILSQMHVYLKAPALGKGWCVQGNSVVPTILDRGDMFGWDGGNRIDINIDISSHTLCELSPLTIEGNQWAHLSGKACDFASLQKAWWDADQTEYAKKILQSQWRMHGNTIQSIHMIALDRETHLSPLPAELDALNVINVKKRNRQHQLAAWVTEQSQKKPLVVFLLGRCDFDNESFNSGVILFERDEGGIRHWRRVGVCVWLHSHLPNTDDKDPLWPLLRGEGEGWRHLEGIMG